MISALQKQKLMPYIEKWSNKSPLFKNISCISLLALTALFCIMPFIAYQSLFVSHDINFHLFQSDQFYRCISSGSLFPKWVLNSNNGYGSANFIFYSPLSYYFVTAIHLFNPSLINSMIVAIWCSFFFSGVSMFMATKRHAGFAVAFFVATIYQIFPSHIFDLYFRGAFAELFAFIWFPLIIISLLNLSESKNNHASAVVLGVSYAGLILTHLVSAFIFTIIICAYLIYRFFMRAKHPEILSISASIALGLGLSSFYLIPVIFEKKLVQIGYVYNYAFGNYSKNFLFMLDNLKGVSGWFYYPIHMAVIMEIALFSLIIQSMYTKNQIKDKKLQNPFFIFLFLFSFFMTTPASRFIWDIVPGLKTIQLPWRWVVIMELSLLYLLIICFTLERKNSFVSGGLKNRSVVYMLIFLGILSVITIFKGNNKISEKELISILNQENPGRLGCYSNLPKEYTPIWATDLEKLLKIPNHNKISILSGESFTRISAWQPEKRIIHVEVFAPALIRIATFYYPGWIAELEGRRIDIKIEKNTGAILIALPKGKHILTLKFVDTSLRSMAKYVSLFSCFLLTTFVIASNIKLRTNED